MVKRTRISLSPILEWENLCTAMHRAARGKHHRPSVRRFVDNAQVNLEQLRGAIVKNALPLGEYRSFVIRDPKRRTIHAACFEDRVYHHALMNVAGPVFERSMSPMSFACRPGFGPHKAVAVVQQAVRRYAWYGKIDIARYFDCIDHGILYDDVLHRRFKGRDFLARVERLIGSYEQQPNKGLPIGALTSQYFANAYLDGLDRLLSQSPLVRAHVRYMDDVVWWCHRKADVKAVLESVTEYLWQARRLTIKPTWQVQRSQQGIRFCGYRVLPAAIRLSVRKKRRFKQRRLFWEQAYQTGQINADELQCAFASVHSIIQGANARGWQREHLQRYPPLDV